jgi:hypothetical protein
MCLHSDVQDASTLIVLRAINKVLRFSGIRLSNILTLFVEDKKGELVFNPVKCIFAVCLSVVSKPAFSDLVLSA